MRALFINAEKKEITEISLDGSLDAICTHLGCQFLQIYHEFQNGDVCHIDDEAPTKESKPHWFMIKGHAHPFPGNGLILGTNSNGYDTDARTELKTLKKEVYFFSEEAVQAGYGQIEWQQRVYGTDEPTK